MLHRAGDDPLRLQDQREALKVTVHLPRLEHARGKALALADDAGLLVIPGGRVGGRVGGQVGGRVGGRVVVKLVVELAVKLVGESLSSNLSSN